MFNKPTLALTPVTRAILFALFNTRLEFVHKGSRGEPKIDKAWTSYFNPGNNLIILTQLLDLLSESLGKCPRVSVRIIRRKTHKTLQGNIRRVVTMCGFSGMFKSRGATRANTKLLHRLECL